MRLPALRQFALSLSHTTWVKQWGECLVFKVAGKMFLIIALDAETIDGVVFKCTPEEFDAGVRAGLAAGDVYTLEKRARLDDAVAGLVEQLRGHRAGADPGDVGLGDAEHIVDGVGADTGPSRLRSKRPSSALKTLPQRPHRTQPSDTLSWSSTTRKIVPHAVQRVAKLIEGDCRCAAAPPMRPGGATRGAFRAAARS